MFLACSLHGLYYNDKKLKSGARKQRMNNELWKEEQGLCILYWVLISQIGVKILPRVCDDWSGDMTSHHPLFCKYKCIEKYLKFVLSNCWHTTQKQQQSATWSYKLHLIQCFITQGLQNKICLILFLTNEFPDNAKVQKIVLCVYVYVIWGLLFSFILKWMILNLRIFISD